MREFKISPLEWAGLDWKVKRALHYFRVMEAFNIRLENDIRRREMQERAAPKGR